MDDDSSEENHKSAKELEDDKRAEKEAQQKLVSITSKQTSEKQSVKQKQWITTIKCNRQTNKQTNPGDDKQVEEDVQQKLMCIIDNQ